MLACSTAGGGCGKHGGKPECHAEGCNMLACSTAGGGCGKHGGHPECDAEGCNNRATSTAGGGCDKHGGKPECHEEGCNKIACSTMGGGCHKHGGMPECSVEGCGTSVQNGFDTCVHHMGNCEVPSCKRKANCRGKEEEDLGLKSCGRHLPPCQLGDGCTRAGYRRFTSETAPQLSREHPLFGKLVGLSHCQRWKKDHRL